MERTIIARSVNAADSSYLRSANSLLNDIRDIAYRPALHSNTFGSDYYNDTKYYGLSVPQSYDLAGVFFLVEKIDYHFFSAKKQGKDRNKKVDDNLLARLKSLRQKIEKGQDPETVAKLQQQTQDSIRPLIDPLYLKAQELEASSKYLSLSQWQKRKFIEGITETRSTFRPPTHLPKLGFLSPEMEKLFDNAPDTKEKLAFIKKTQEQYLRDLNVSQ
jgi:hypothetical protein